MLTASSKVNFSFLLQQLPVFPSPINSYFDTKIHATAKVGKVPLVYMQDKGKKSCKIHTVIKSNIKSYIYLFQRRCLQAKASQAFSGS